MTSSPQTFILSEPCQGCQIGFDSVTDSITHDMTKLKILDAYGIQMTRDVIDEDSPKIERAYFDDNAIGVVLEQPQAYQKNKSKSLERW
ncbi:MAG: hypothetical protein H7A33_04605 [Deltaproteobacteria bacterium]|nr:hypothetical protein [Deltaproteobacteria bacterium]